MVVERGQSDDVFPREVVLFPFGLLRFKILDLLFGEGFVLVLAVALAFEHVIEEPVLIKKYLFLIIFEFSENGPELFVLFLTVHFEGLGLVVTCASSIVSVLRFAEFSFLFMGENDCVRVLPEEKVVSV